MRLSALLIPALALQCGEVDPPLPEGCVADAAGVPTCPWPAEPDTQAQNLTSLEGAAPNDFYENLSAAFWDDANQRLWVGRNGPDDLSKIWALEPDGAGGYAIVRDANDVRAEWTHFGDLEGLTRVPSDDPWLVFTLVEDSLTLERWDLANFKNDHQLDVWDISDALPQDVASGDGPEGVTFVTDAVLTAGGFTDADGQPATSQGGMGGLFLVSHQHLGRVYALDLDANGDTVDLIGVYETAADETAALELDAQTGLLYMWHGDGNGLLEVARLSSSPGVELPRLDTVWLYEAPEGMPPSRNWEGLALEPESRCAAGSRSLFLTEDDGGASSLLRFDFPCE